MMNLQVREADAGPPVKLWAVFIRLLLKLRVIYLEVIFSIIALSLSGVPFISLLLLSFTFPPF